MEILARFSHEQVDHTQDSNIHLVVTLKAPTLDWVAKRPQLCVLPVIDLSGSMEGPKLRYAKQSLEKLVDQLQDGDYAGLIGFETQVHILATPQKVTSEFKDQLKAKIRTLRVLGSTNFAEAMVQAAQQIERLDLPPTFLKRVIMFTDGQPTAGITDTKKILKMVGGLQGGATISAFGYGDLNGGCDQQFLTEFSTLGKGNYAYVQNPDDALSAFGREFGGLLSTYATSLDLDIEPANGHHIVKTVTNVEATTDVTGTHEIKIPDVLSEETRHFVFEVRIAKQPKALPREFTAFDIKLTYGVLTEQGTKERRTVETKAKIRFAKADEVKKSGDKDIHEVIALHQIIRAQLEAEEEAKKGNFEAAAARMGQVAQEVKTKGGLNHLAEAALQAQSRLGSQHKYLQGQGYLRSFARSGTRQYGSSALDADAQAVLTSCNVATSNNAMSAYEDVFRSEDAAVPVPPKPPAKLSKSKNKSG